jgi:hypothetical protein
MNLAVMAILALGVFALVVWIGRSGARTPMDFLKRKGRKVAGFALVVAALALLARGRWEIALPIAGIGWFMVTGSAMPNLHPLAWLPERLMGKPQPKSLQRDGERITVTMGRYAGRRLDDLGKSDFPALARELSRLDPAALPLLEEELDRRFPGWREDMQANPHLWGLGGRAGGGSGAMTEDEAYQILGLAPGAGAEAIRDAHRALIKKLHPDAGGSTYLAARVNEAKALLMKRHS